MKAAFAVWDGNISPVFDVTRQILVVDAEAGRIIGEKKQDLRDEMPGQKALYLSNLGVQTLVCGAISRSVQAMVEGFGIRVIPFVTGELQKVVHAWLRGSLENGRFAMPGCCRQNGSRGRPGTCVCPKCGQREPHQRGVPCVQKQCPRCGAAMNRD